MFAGGLYPAGGRPRFFELDNGNAASLFPSSQNGLAFAVLLPRLQSLGDCAVAPDTRSFQPAALLALGAAVALGAELIFIKKLSGREPPLQILWVNNLIGLGISTTVAMSFWQAPSPAQWGALIALGLIMACAQLCFVNAMARAEASFIAPFTYATLVFVAIC